MENGVPYAIDFMNPVPDADLQSVGSAHFEWIVDRVADMLITKARKAPQPPQLRWSAFLGADLPNAKALTPMKKPSPPIPPGKHAAAKPKTAEPKRTSKLAAEEERAAASDEPMGSIAAAVPGSNARAQDAIESPQLPGAEEPRIVDKPRTTAGTEFKRKPGSTGAKKGSR